MKVERREKERERKKKRKREREINKQISRNQKARIVRIDYRKPEDELIEYDFYFITFVILSCSSYSQISRDNIVYVLIQSR